MPKRVITVHGIQSEGAWQDRVKKVLEPHFRCDSVRYGDYRPLGLGALRVVIDERPLVALVGALNLSGSFRGLPILSAMAVIVAIGIAGAFVRRDRVALWFKHRIGIRAGERPHLIAHSFGTYLSGRSLKYPDTRFARIVLTGCVLPRSFGWKAAAAGNRFAFDQIRNEVGRRDYVAVLAAFARLLVPGLGNAGYAGFVGDGALIHDQESAYGPCQHCAPGAAAIHNVLIDKFTHNDFFIDVGHARSFWLPFLWGIPPFEYQQLLELCGLAADMEAPIHRITACRSSKTIWETACGRGAARCR